MLTIICEKPGTLRAVDRPIPVPAAGEVLLRVKRVGVCGTDLHIFAGRQPYLEYPRVMGHELSAIVAQAPSTSRLAEGDMVYVMPYLSCGHCVACRQGRTNCCVALQVLGVHRDGQTVGEGESVCSFASNATVTVPGDQGILHRPFGNEGQQRVE